MQNVGYPSLCHFSEVMARKQLIEMQKKKRQGTSVCLYLIPVAYILVTFRNVPFQK